MVEQKGDVNNITLDDLLEEVDISNQQQGITMFQKSQDVTNSFLRDQRFEMLPPAHRGKQISTQQKTKNDRQSLHAHDGFSLKQRHEIISDPSGGMLSDYRADADSSYYSRRDSYYQATLLKWDTLVHDEIQNNIYTAIKNRMNEVTIIAIFSSKKQTYIYIETPKGVRRDCFQHNQMRKGTNALMKCGPPVPWNKTVDPVNINKELSKFLQESYWSVQVKGSINEAYDVIKELKEKVNGRKREDKGLMKAVEVAWKQEDKLKAKNYLWESIKDRYLGVLVREPVAPKEWINAEYPDSDPENTVALRLIIEGKLQAMTLYYKNACEIKRPEQRFEPTSCTLQNYVKSYGSDEEAIDCIKSVNDAGHGRLLRATHNLLFGEKTKRRTVWISGVASSGKSMFIRRLRSIFGSDEVDWRGVYLPVKKRYNGNIKTQLVTCEEFSFKNAFSDANYHVTKMLFEGEGANVRKDLYAQFEPCYEDVAFVVASNKLPGTEAQARDETFNQDIWGPIVSRVDFVYMTMKHDEKEVFPYTTVQLARALLFLTNNEDLISKMEELDNSIIPEDNDIARINQHKQLADRQQKIFAELLELKAAEHEKEYNN